ncbi:MAG: hypothetical protein JWN08_210 [Frankiales bacterium]|nr:hypothetical protein [Frankiales bacterium]
MFGRRKKGSSDEAVEVEDVDAVEQEDASAPPPRPSGPWDDDDAPDDDVNRIDLGGLQVPVPPDTEVRVDVSPEGEVVAATLVRGDSAMQVNAFAAPRSYGIWAEVREEIGAALREGGGRADDAEGPYGTELHAAVPTQVEGQGVGLAPARFIGVDGPRWFLRALLTGPAATDPAAAADLEAALRDVVVVRGSDPMAVRDPLPLRLPKQVTEAAEAGATAAADDEAEQPSLLMPERGPEITERR